MVNRTTDLLIPQSAFSSWSPEVGPRPLRRPLTDSERRDLEQRRDELAPALGPYQAVDVDLVALALLDMYNGFTSIRGGEEEAAARVDSTARLLADLPAWAIQRACLSIRRNGVWRKGAFDRQWPPNDAEIVHAVRQEMRLYADTHARCVALLTGPVEERP